MKDWKFKSFLEAIIDVLLWVVINVSVIVLIIWVNVEKSFFIAMLMLCLAIFRKYLVRRLFVCWLYEYFKYLFTKNDEKE